MSNHNDDFRDELLSAYVDGELTAAERAAVEERLRADPQAAELVNELRAVSSAIKSLPRETPGRDLQASIQAELDETRADERREVIPLSEPLDPPRGFYRGFLWSTVAIAAALMIMFLQQQRDGERNVAAVAKNDALGVEEHTARNNRGRRLAANGEPPPLGEMRSTESPSDAATPAAGVGGGRERLDAESQRSLAAAEAETESLVQLEEQGVASDAVLSPPAPSPAQSPQQAAELAMETVELEVRADDGVRLFSQLLAENNFQTPPTESAAASARPSPEAQHSTMSRGAAQFYYSQSRSGQPAAEDAEVQVVVEGAPAQVEQLVDAYRRQPEVFAEVAAPESLIRRGGEYRREAAFSAGAPINQSKPQSTAQDAAVAGKAAGSASSTYGWAWFLPPEGGSSDESLYSGRIEAREKGAEGARPEVETIAERLQSPPAEDRVRLKFVLRPAPQPAAAAAPATAEP